MFFKNWSNEFWFFLRRRLRIKKGSYREQSPEHLVLPPEAEPLNKLYGFDKIGPKLLPRRWIFNLATLWYLERFFSKVTLAPGVRILEPGCQNFARLPALRAFFEKKCQTYSITGLELDAFVPVQGFNTLWDQAQYFLSLKDDDSRFIDADYFQHHEVYDIVICFYPFVSAPTALAWGIPARYAGAEYWLRAFAQSLAPGGYVFVVHQGEWEEKDFDRAREKGFPLQLIHRDVLECPFFKTRHPAHASLYQKAFV